MKEVSKEYLYSKGYVAAYGFSDGMEMVEKDDYFGYVDQSGRLVIPCIYDWGFPFKNGFAVVEKDGKRLAIDKQGNTFRYKGDREDVENE